MSISRDISWGVSHFMSELGISRNQALGIMDSLYGESRFSTQAHNPRDPGSGSHGIAQWHSGRWNAMQSYARSRGKSARDLRTQIEFVAKEYKTTEKKAFNALKAAESRKAAARVHTQKYERPAAKYAKQDRNARYGRVVDSILAGTHKGGVKGKSLTQADIPDDVADVKQTPVGPMEEAPLAAMGLDLDQSIYGSVLPSLDPAAGRQTPAGAAGLLATVGKDLSQQMGMVPAVNSFAPTQTNAGLNAISSILGFAPQAAAPAPAPAAPVAPATAPTVAALTPAAPATGIAAGQTGVLPSATGPYATYAPTILGLDALATIAQATSAKQAPAVSARQAQDESMLALDALDDDDGGAGTGRGKGRGKGKGLGGLLDGLFDGDGKGKGKGSGLGTGGLIGAIAGGFVGGPMGSMLGAILGSQLDEGREGGGFGGDGGFLSGLGGLFGGGEGEGNGGGGLGFGFGSFTGFGSDGGTRGLGANNHGATGSGMGGEEGSGFGGTAGGTR